MKAVCIVLPSLLLAAAAQDTYRAAVYQHTRIRVHNNATATKLANVAAYATAARSAAGQHADIIVFPEIGLGSNEIDRAINAEYCEDVPDGSEQITPCDGNSSYCSTRPALCQLSCIARTNSIYMVVGMNDIKPCSSSQPCPKDNRLLFNTAVVFDRNGMVIQRYHKKHIFSPFPVFDVPTPAEVRTFATDFGVRFGVFICFDMLFPDPPLELIKQGLTHYVYPTSWVNVPPLLTATQYQQAWSRTFNTTLLASNTGEVATSGSGIYTCGTIHALYFNASGNDATDSKLLLATLPTEGCGTTVNVDETAVVNKGVETVVAAVDNKPMPVASKPSSAQHDEVQAFGGDKPECGLIGIEKCACDIVQMQPGLSGVLQAQYKDLSCRAHYEFDPNQQATGEFYGLVVFSGVEWFIESLPIQYCAFVKCATPTTCVVTSTSNNSTRYDAASFVKSWSITGNFTSHQEQQFPLLVVDGGSILSPSAMVQSSNTIASGTEHWPSKLLHTALLARTWNSTRSV